MSTRLFPGRTAKGDVAIGRDIARDALDIDRRPIGIEFF